MLHLSFFVKSIKSDRFFYTYAYPMSSLYCRFELFKILVGAGDNVYAPTYFAYSQLCAWCMGWFLGFYKNFYFATLFLLIVFICLNLFMHEYGYTYLIHIGLSKFNYLFAGLLGGTSRRRRCCWSDLRLSTSI